MPGIPLPPNAPNQEPKPEETNDDKKDKPVNPNKDPDPQPLGGGPIKDPP